MASGNDALSNSNFGENSSNCNNNETEIPTSSTVSSRADKSSHRINCSGGTSNKGNIMTGGGTIDCRNLKTAINDGHTSEQQSRRDENPFSFRQFLNRDINTTSLGNTNNSNLSNNSALGNNSASGTMTGEIRNFLENDCINYVNSSNHINNMNNNSNNVVNESDAKISFGQQRNLNALPINETNSCQNFTNAMVTNAGTSSLTSPSSSYQTSTGARPKVPLNNSNNSTGHPILSSSSISTTSISSLTSETSKMKRSPRFSSFDSQASLAEIAGNIINGCSSNVNCSTSSILRDGVNDDRDIERDHPVNSIAPNTFRLTDYDRQYVHRSYSNYDLDLQPRACNTSTEGPVIDGLSSPRRRVSPTRSTNRVNPRNYTTQSSNTSNKSQQSATINNRPNNDFAAVLPDFVQDHYMDPWYYNDMNLSSPHNSPASPVDFVEDLSVIGNSDKCRALPDFLNDGPIIRTPSSRLADVAAGLPDLDSPDDNSPNLQISRLKLENERLRRELDESRLALAEQTRRMSDLERRFEQTRSRFALAQSAQYQQQQQQLQQQQQQLHLQQQEFQIQQQKALEISEEQKLEENSNKKRHLGKQNEVEKLKQHVKQLTAEVETLKQRNEHLREEGAVGGDRIPRKPSRSQQLSGDLLRAASTAENNLRQLLNGVDNLRLIAATMENMDNSEFEGAGATVNPISNDDFLSDCGDDYDDISGPAL